jgi:hypothetical protein
VQILMLLAQLWRQQLKQRLNWLLKSLKQQ